MLGDLVSKAFDIFDWSIIGWLKMHSIMCPSNYYILKIHTLLLKESLITQNSNSRKRGRLTYMVPVFWDLWVPLGSDPKFDPPGFTAYLGCDLCPNFVFLAPVVPEIMRLKGVVTS